MKKQITIDIDQTTYDNAKAVLNSQYLNIDTAFEMFLKRTIKERSVLWLFENKNAQDNNSVSCDADTLIKENRPNRIATVPTANVMTKNLAIRMFTANGNTVSKPTTFASKNKSAYNYWANPNWHDVINSDWTLILNDYRLKKLYLFFIPKFTFTKNDFITRADNSNQIDLQIAYNDPTFTDNRSKISFRKFLVDDINY